MRLAFATACLGLGLGIACSSGSGGNGEGPATSSGAFAADFCNLIKPCCAQAGLSTTGTLCQAFAQAAAAQGSYDAANGQACISGMQAESGTPTLCNELGNDIPACSQVFSTPGGSAPAGAPCMQDSDCAKPPEGSATCFDNVAFVDGGSTQTQTCLETTVGQAGDGPCVGTVQASYTDYQWSGSGPPPVSGVTCAIASGLTCSETTQKCVALATVGQPCESDSDCVLTAYCAYMNQSNVCTARLPDGASCGPSPDQCAMTSYCDPGLTTCQPQLPAGSPCTTSQQCTGDECVNGACGAGSNLGLQLLCGTN